MPQFRVTCAVAGREVSVFRAVCDGCDPVRPCDEHTERASLWVLTAGAFELRDAGGRRVVDPTRAIVMPRHHAFQIRHPSGPDTCLSFRGPLVEALAAHGPRLLAIAPADVARLIAGVADRDELALAEVLTELAPPGPGAAAPDRDLSAAVAHALRARYAE